MATFGGSGSDPEHVQRGFEEINRRAAAGLPEDLPDLEPLDLYTAGAGKVLSIPLFDTEGILGRATRPPARMILPKSGATGRRVSVEPYEVPDMIDAWVGASSARLPRAGLPE